ncbi:hypothetical protein ACLOJK_020432 [Asimina triloba]
MKSRSKYMTHGITTTPHLLELPKKKIPLPAMLISSLSHDKNPTPQSSPANPHQPRVIYIPPLHSSPLQAFPPMHAELKASEPSISIPNPNLFSDLPGALKGCLGNLDGACIEKLLQHCASALEAADTTFAQQVMWVLNNVASPVGDPNQRLTSWLLQALVARSSRICPTANAMSFHDATPPTAARPMSLTDLTRYVDLIPWHRFGFCASNSAIYDAVQGRHKVHVLDLSITHCMQWPTLIDALSERPQGPPSLRITVPSSRPPVPPFLAISNREVGLRLANFAKSRDVPFSFHVMDGPPPPPPAAPESPDHHEFLLTQLTSSALDLKQDEALIINCQNWLRYLPNKENFLETIKGLDPCMVVVVDEEADLDSPDLTTRITACFNYLWILFDAVEALLPKESGERMEYEADVGHKIENMIAFEGSQRIERSESSGRLAQQMNKAEFVSVPFGEETVVEVKSLLDEHASGWGLKREDDKLILTWKGHNSIFATAWVPSYQVS